MKAFKEYQKETGLCATRLRLGLTQKCMAIELGISENMLCRVEGGSRRMPASALSRLSALEIKLAAGATIKRHADNKDVWTAAEKASIYKSAVIRAEKCRLSAARWQQVLNGMVARYEKLYERISQVETLLHNTGEGKPSPREQHLQLHRNVLLTKLHKCGRLAQHELRHRIALLHAEAQLHTIDAAGCTGF